MCKKIIENVKLQELHKIRHVKIANKILINNVNSEKLQYSQTKIHMSKNQIKI